MTEIEISSEGVMYKGKLSSEYDSAFSKLTAGAEVKVDAFHPEKGFASKAPLTMANKFGDKVFLSTTISPKPPNQVVFSMSPREIESETPDKQFVLKGTIGFTMTVTLKPRQPSDQASRTVPESSSNWVPAVIIGGLAVVVVATIIVCPPSAAVWGELMSMFGLGVAASKVVTP